MPEHFHFIEPLWLLALLPLALVLWSISHRAHLNSPWRKLVDARLLPLLLDDHKTQGSRLPLWLLSLGWLLAVLALADPAWEQQPQPLRQTSTSRVIVLDLSRSMLATDLKPSRLVRARFKVEDVLAHDAEGQTGLVVFAGDAFTVSPLTRDADTIRAQLRALHPSIMPSQGSRADLGLLKAHELLQQAGVKSGQVVLIADGVEGERAPDAARRLRTAGYQVSVLGVGTPAGAPIPDGRGGSLRDNAGRPLLPRLDKAALASIADAGDGRYSDLHGDQSDLNRLLQMKIGDGESVDSDDLQAQKWKGQGPLLAVLILPIAALAFRRGWVLGILVCAGTLVPPQPAMALSWDALWQRRDQQAAQALQEGLYDQAAELAADPARRGSALYRQGEYEQAAQVFDRASGADGAYNRGNALARLGRYEEAISAYDRALEIQPGMQDALANKAAIEAHLNRQKQKRERPPDPQDSEVSSDQQQNQEPSSAQDEEQQQTSSGEEDTQQQDPQQGQTSSDQADSDPQDQQESSDSAGSGDQEAASLSDANRTTEPQAGQEDHADQPGQDKPNDSAGSGNRDTPSQSDDRQAPETQTAEQQNASRAGQDGLADSTGGEQENATQADESQASESQTGEEQAAVKADRDAESDPADGGNQERRIGSEEQQASEEEPGPGQRRNESENQFADANRKLDQGGDDEESAQNAGEKQRESDSDSQRRGGDEALARQPPTADRRAQPRAPDPATGTRAQALSSEEQMAAQQWLRRIPDDPGGLLRRKFLYQYQQRARRPDGGSHQDW